MANGPMLRMNELDKVEKEVVSCLQNTGKALEEVGKDNLFGVVSTNSTSLQHPPAVKKIDHIN